MTAAMFDVHILASWLRVADARWGLDNRHKVEGALQGPWLMIYQDGVYRARIDLSSPRPTLQDFADEEA